MSILIRAIISGFGMKLGQDIYNVVNKKLGVFPDDDNDPQNDDDDDLDEALPISIFGGL
jgi:hypothetical protein